MFSAKKNHRNPLANDGGKFRFGVINVKVLVVLNCSNQVKNFLGKKSWKENDIMTVLS